MLGILKRILVELLSVFCQNESVEASRIIIV